MYVFIIRNSRNVSHKFYAPFDHRHNKTAPTKEKHIYDFFFLLAFKLLYNENELS